MVVTKSHCTPGLATRHAIGELLVYRFLKNTLATKIKQLTPLSHHLKIAIATIASSYHRPSD